MSEQDWEMLREEIKPEKRRSVWLVSFTDMITLILAFFILLYAMKETRDNQSLKMTAPLSGETGTHYGGNTLSGPEKNTGIEHTIILTQKVFALNYLEALFRKLLESDPLLSKVQYGRTPTHLVLSFDFSSLLDKQNEQAERSVAILVNTLARVENKIEILTIIENNADWGKATDTSQSIAKILNNSGYNRDILISVFGGGENPVFSEALRPGAVNILISE